MNKNLIKYGAGALLLSTSFSAMAFDATNTMSSTTGIPNYGMEMKGNGEMKSRSGSGEMNMRAPGQIMKKANEQIRENRQEFRTETGTLMQFIRKDLTETEKKSFVEIMNAFGKQFKAVLEDTTLTPEARLTKIKELNAYQYEKVLPYVIVGQESAFKAFIESRTALMETNKGIRKDAKEDMRDMRDDMKEQKKDMKSGSGMGMNHDMNTMKPKFKLLTPKTVDTLNKKLDVIPSDKKEAVFTALINRIDVLVANTTDEKKKTLLLEIKTVVQDKLNALKSETEQGNILNEILTDTTVTQ